MDPNGELYDRAGRGRRRAFATEQQEDQPLIAALRGFVEGSGLRVPRVAKLMGVGDATLQKWLAGTVRPTQKKLLEIESFLSWHGREYIPNSFRDKAASP